ncbi:hypothetical protein [Mesorhizobium sp. SEMIA 3007]|uniref:hypothetical protein n=1 Tax=Mesorhizobium sp. SEMIA 3007 TaxID=1862350 RepID=UPI000AEE102C|nr:hypothetical protein [Mesorhizobium sp. SEMIA 3007]
MTSAQPVDTILRPAIGSDAAAIATMMRAALSSFDWMPVLHTPEEDLFFIRDIVLPRQQVTVAEAGKVIAGSLPSAAIGWSSSTSTRPGRGKASAAGC